VRLACPPSWLEDYPDTTVTLEAARSKRTSFAEITDQEVERIETAVWGIWQESQQEKASENR
jgi:hypothetical protein